jgi:hypothetical protein
MDLRPSPENSKFRLQVRDFLDNELPISLRGETDCSNHSTREGALAWQKILFIKGWGAPSWPIEHRGTGSG